MQSEARLRAAREEEEALVDQLIQRNPFPLPEGMMREYLDELLQRLSEEGRRWSDEEKERLRTEYRPMAERRMKRDLLLDAVARQESIDVLDEETDQLLRGAAEGDVPPPEMERLLRSPEQRDRARSHLMERKVFQLLREKARVKMPV